METKIIALKGYCKACKNCGTFFRSIRSDAKYCSSKCGNEYRKKKLIRKGRLQTLLAFFGLGSNVKTPKDKVQRKSAKIDYARLTFILSFIGFLGSIGFYLGVLREVYSPERDKQQIEVLNAQNVELQHTVSVLVEKLKEDE